MRFFQFGTRSIKRKIMLGYVALLIAPLVLLTVFIYIRTSETIQNKAIEQFHTVTQFANQQFDQYFKDIDNLSFNILNNDRVQAALTEPPVPAVDWTTREIAEQDALHNFLDGIYKLKPGISSIIIYGFNGQNYFYHPTRRWDDTVDNSTQNWYRQAIANDGRWALTGLREERQLFNTLDPNPEQVVTFYREIKDIDNYKPLGVLAINVKLETVRELAGLNDRPNALLLSDGSGEPIVAGPGAASERRKSSKWLTVSSVSPYTGWTTEYQVPKSELFKETKQIRNFIILLTVVLLAVALLVSGIVSGGIVKPLQRLRSAMREVERGELNAQLVPTTRDEVGEMTRGFNRMVERVKALVEEVREQESERTRTELNALQARINPHFMYNTLNGIRWVAMMERNQRVTDMLTSFIYLLRFSAKQQSPLVTVADELEVLRHYVVLMKMRNDQFDFDLAVDEGMKEQRIVPFLLQPIVENAIFHGIVPLGKRGSIRVELEREGEWNVARVRDDGVGIADDKRATLFAEAPAKHDNRLNQIGLKNVYDRLKLQFGDGAELAVNSASGQGTEVVIRWPANV